MLCTRPSSSAPPPCAASIPIFFPIHSRCCYYYYCYFPKTKSLSTYPNPLRSISTKQMVGLGLGLGLGRRMASPISPVVFFLLGCFLCTFVSADKFTVGDSKGWNPGVNYTIWEEKHRPFHLGDWLVFYYQSGMADVIQVDAVAYNKCDASNPISNYSKGRSYAFELNETKRYYFICSFGYCYGGMKLSVLAQPLPPPSPPPSHNKSQASPPFLLLLLRRRLLLFFIVTAAALL